MRVQDIMRRSPTSCIPTTNLAAAVRSLNTAACEALPVVDAEGKLLGIITHRDICAALSSSNQPACQLAASQAMSGNLAVCRASDEVHAALRIMKSRRVRHLPVVDEGGKLEGIMCMSDIILHARHDDGRRPDLSYEDVMGALISIYCHCQPVVIAS